ncbi:Dipeptidyl aminopeptidase/acylaminoacyl peptidase [Paenibacillus sp. cl141a]|uniref:S9 family peptidase n=1 Tax=Paenibacillus sp. cl141a TaxID=1761877 RepID=UPI0008CF18E9|nr:S9 family peptidase [Paenibacillus sp. cl141a]SEL46917.1 Dipeptidyl aminopeptidase/acylaminoacyl peptidase [Paenibacillus sp. cl141a]
MTDKRLITPEDLYRIHWVNDPVVSPASGAIAYVHKSVSEKHDGYRSHIRLLPAGGDQDIPFTSGEADAAPAWSPDGSELAFLRKKGDKPQVWIMPANGGEARPATDLKHGVSAFKWSPDSSLLLVRSEAEAAESTESEEKYNDDKHKLPEEKIINRIKYKADGPGLWNDRRHHLYIVNPATEESQPITEGDFDVYAFAWSPDGGSIAYSSTLATEQFPDPDLRLTNDVFVMDLSSGSVTEITDGTLSIGSIAFTPDGQHVLMLASDLSCGFATLTKIHLVPLSGGEARVLFTDMDVQLGHAAVSDMRAGAGTPPLFSKDGRSVYVQLSQDGGVHIGRFALDGSSFELVVAGEREVYQFALTPEENVVFAAADPLQPGDLFSFTTGSNEEHRLTNCNEELGDELNLSTPESFTFRTSDGWPIQGWIMKPAEFKEGTKVPAVLEIHGGPQAMYAHTFMHEFQLLAAAGYAVFYTNPRGGHGYGQVHVNTVRGDYGGRDYQDLMEAVDYVVETYDFVDASRLGVTGGSYGGFMTNWIVGHTDRFQAAVTQRSISNWISFYGVSDIGYTFTQDQIWGNPWDNLDKLWKHSPLAYVKNVNTPLLILHGEQDLRCPIEQGEQLFIALKKLGRKTQLIRFPGADHNLSRSGHPHLRVKRLSHIVRWFVEHIEK